MKDNIAILGALYKQRDFPVAEKISNEIMSLPMNPYLDDSEIEYITKAL